MDDLIVEFLTETNESLGELDLDLVKLEQNPNDNELLSNIFRLMHTIKGTCGFLGLPRLEKVAHHAENVLGRFRDGELEVTPDYVTLIFESLDTIKTIIAGIEETGTEPDGDDVPLIAKLDAVYEGRDGQDSGQGGGQGGAQDESAAETATESGEGSAGEGAQDEPIFEPIPAGQQPPPQESAPAEKPVEKAQATAAKTDTDAKAGAAPLVAQTLRVNVDVLENLMTMVSELVLTRNQLIQIMRHHKDSEFSAPLQRLNHVVSELQEGVMKTRMQPVGNAWSKLPRIIRDLSMELGKKIDLEMKGQDTELDRQVLEMIKDPLTHMVRNSADHGIEMPADRAAAGKPETGHILLNAYHEGGHIIIEIHDDGKGLNMDKIKEKIIANGLATQDELDELSTQQIQQYIFKPGFSTAEAVTAVSGRGVGMDVVRTNIEKIGGSVELRSVEGKGSTFFIKIPLTLAIVSALIVESAGERFAIPQLAVRELVLVSPKSETQVEIINGTPVYRLRDQLLPLVSLGKLLELESSQDGSAYNGAAHANGAARPGLSHTELPVAGETEEAEDEIVTSDGAAQSDEAVQGNAPENNTAAHRDTAPESQAVYIVVTQVGTYTFGIIVNQVFDTEEIVVKPVASILKDIGMFAGNTILGDGSVIMILDPAGIANASGDMDSSGTVSDDQAESGASAQSGKQKTALLLFRANDGTPRAVPLSLVSRLERIDLAETEGPDESMVIQYRGALMPLLSFDGQPLAERKGSRPVLVFSDNQRTMGLIVDEIIDIAEEHIDIQVSASGQGLVGSTIINGKATDVIDVIYFLQKANHNWFKTHGDTPFSEASSHTPKILLVDDSPFFRDMLSPMLSVAGYQVIALESPAAALEMCESGESFDAIISDIEMPGMNGFEFAEKLRQGTKWQNTPLIALSSHTTPQDIERGRQVGFNEYVAKFDRDTLLDTLSDALSKQVANG